MKENAAPGGGENKSNATLSVNVKIYPMKNQEAGKGNLLAFANVTLGGCFAITNIRVMNGEKGPFVAMPSQKGKDEQYHETCFPTTSQMRKDLSAAVMEEFGRTMQKDSVRGAIQNGQREAAARPPQKADRGRAPGAR